jgi:thiol reductant ABC exporter CydD subunit
VSRTGPRRGPIDPRLASRSRTVRRFMVLSALLGLLATAAVVAQAVVIAHAVARGFTGRAKPLDLIPALSFLAGLFLIRAAASRASETLAHRTASAVKTGLRRDLLAAILRLAPSNEMDRPAGEVAVAAGRGLDALDGYLSRYVPQLMVAALAPVAIMAWVVTVDPISAASMAVVVVLIPVFGVLLGLAARHRAERQWRQIASFSGHFLDIVQGLTTLRALGRSKGQSKGIVAANEGLRAKTMSTLRVAFLSAFALELLAAIGTALVAVTLAIRMLHGSVGLGTALAVLIVTPEVFLPLRQASAQFHASAEGIAALDTVFAILDRDSVSATAAPVMHTTRATPSQAKPPAIQIEGLTIERPSNRRPALAGVSLTVDPGEHVLVVGASGSGKTTLFDALMAFLAPTAGRILVDGTDLRHWDVEAWRRLVAWVPQHPHLFSGTVADNIALGRPRATRTEIIEAATAAGAKRFIERLSSGFDTLLGEDGCDLSGGERQRVALARAILRDAPIILLDEPTASLDDASAEVVKEAVARVMPGRTLLVSSHRPGWLDLVDRVVKLDSGKLVEVPQVARLAS